VRSKISFKRHRFPAAVILHAVWLYFRFTLSLRDVEELLAGAVSLMANCLHYEAWRAVVEQGFGAASLIQAS
jgi:transposase-like protein